MFNERTPARLLVLGSFREAIPGKIHQNELESVGCAGTEEVELPGRARRLSGANEPFSAKQRVEQARFSDVRSSRECYFRERRRRKLVGGRHPCQKARVDDRPLRVLWLR